MKVYFNGATLYQLLLFLLIIEEREVEKKYIFSESIPKEILENIENKIIMNEVFVKFNNKMLKGILFIFYLLKVKFSFHFGKLKEVKKYKIYGDSLNVEFFIRNSVEVYLLEDGLKNYSTKNKKINRIERLLTRIFWKINKNELEKINKIFLTGLAPIPKDIEHKVEIINLKQLWSKKTLKEQNEILNIFSFDLNIKETIKGRDIILFTQPLSEDGILTEEEKIEIYLNIVKRYPDNRLILKTHPREKTNYKDIFKDNLVLDNPFPFEILNLLDVKFNKAVTLFSTAALGLGEDVEVDFYGTEVNEKVLARFGSCDNIMKRNSYLEEEER